MANPQIQLLAKVHKKDFFIEQHCMRSVPIGSFSGPYFPEFGRNMER